MSKLLKLVWWTRGVMAALAILGVVIEFTDIDRPTFLRAVHAVLVGWNKLMALIGDYIGTLPYVPHLSSNEINLIIIVALIYVPSVISFNSSIKFLERYRYFDWKLWTLWLACVFLLSGLQSLLIWYHITNPFGFERVYVTLSIASFLVAVSSALWIIRKTHPSYVSGIISCAFILMTWELLYLANLPAISSGIEEISCEILEIPKDEC